MVEPLTLDKLADELIESSEHFSWPEDNPQVRESWLAALQQNPSILAEHGQDYTDLVTHFFYDLSNLGNRMASISLGDLPRRLKNVHNGVEEYSSNLRTITKKLNGIMAVLNLQKTRAVYYNLRRIARARLISGGGRHDLSNLIGSAGFLSPDNIDDTKIKSLEARGRHAQLVGLGGANMMVYGPLVDVDLRSDVFYILKELFKTDAN